MAGGFTTQRSLHRGSVLGLYRKLYPAINASVYEAGRVVPTFQVGELTFGIVICNESNYAEPLDSWPVKVRRHSRAHQQRSVLREGVARSWSLRQGEFDIATAVRELHVGHPRRHRRRRAS